MRDKYNAIKCILHLIMLFLNADDIKGVIQPMMKDSSGRWRHRNNVKLEQQRDNVVFNLEEIGRRYDRC